MALIWTFPSGAPRLRGDVLVAGQPPFPAQSELLTPELITFSADGTASTTELVDGVPLTTLPLGNFFVLDMWPSGASGAGGSRSNLVTTVTGGCGAGGGAHLRRMFTKGELAAMLVRYAGAIPVQAGPETIGGLGRKAADGNGNGAPGAPSVPSRFGDYWTFGGGITPGGIVAGEFSASGGGGTLSPGVDGNPTQNTVAAGGAPNPIGPGIIQVLGLNTWWADGTGEGGGSGAASTASARFAGAAQDGGGGGGLGGTVENGNGSGGGRSLTGTGGGGGGGAVSVTPSAGNGGAGGGVGADGTGARLGGGGTGGTAGVAGGQGADQRTLNEGGQGGGGGGASLGAGAGGNGGRGGYPGGPGGGGGSTQTGDAGNGGNGRAGRVVLRGFW